MDFVKHPLVQVSTINFDNKELGIRSFNSETNLSIKLQTVSRIKLVWNPKPDILTLLKKRLNLTLLPTLHCEIFELDSLELSGNELSRLFRGLSCS